MQFTKILLFFLPCLSMGLEELKTKQLASKIRYISNDGKITYYQKNSGELQVSTNYNFANLLKLKDNTQFQVSASNAQKKILISADEFFHNKLNIFKENKIYLGNLGKVTPPTFIAQGLSAKLHQDDTWISYYRASENKIHLQSVLKDVPKRSITLKKDKLASFTPQIEFVGPNDVLYTDLNDDGHQGLFLYSFTEKDFKLLYKTKRAGHKLELCLINNSLIIGEFGILENSGGSQITSVNLFKGQFKDFETLYSSQFSDLGNMLCDNNSVYFIKTTGYNKTLNLRTTEVSSLNIDTKKLKIHSALKYATNILKISDKIVTLIEGKLLIIKGQNNLTNDQIIESADE